jgi:cytochrome-b5 reductase
MRSSPFGVASKGPSPLQAATYTLGEPVAASEGCVEPGKCVFGEDWKPSKLISKVDVSHDTKVFTFGLEEGQALGLSTCACILAKGPNDADGNPIVRPYTPVSTNAMKGQFEMMIKVYGEGGFSHWLDNLKIGEEAEFKHIGPNVKTQYPFGKKHVGMIVGGTGITPMIQALHPVLGTEGDTTKVSMLFGNKTEKDILCKEALDSWSGDRLAVTHVLSQEPADSSWKGDRGRINEDLIKAKMPKPEDDCIIFVCGPPAMYDDLCGPRTEPELTGKLAEMGYKKEQVFKF